MQGKYITHLIDLIVSGMITVITEIKGIAVVPIVNVIGVILCHIKYHLRCPIVF